MGDGGWRIEIDGYKTLLATVGTTPFDLNSLLGRLCIVRLGRSRFKGKVLKYCAGFGPTILSVTVRPMSR